VAARVTLQTIADTLGISRTTVSNAYNRPDQLAPALRRRVLDTAAELGYAGPRHAGRHLRSGRRGAIGLMFAERLSYAFTDPGAVVFLEGFTEATEEHGHELLLLPGRRGTRQETRAVRDAVVGAFCMYRMPDTHPAVGAAMERRVPVVVVDEPHVPGSPFVGSDDQEGARLAAAHVVRLRHRRVAIITERLIDDGYEGFADSQRIARASRRVSRERVAGYLVPLAAAEPVAVYDVDGNSADQGARGALELLDASPRPTALLCSSDVLAFGAMAALRERGLDVPGDMSVVGFDDVPVAADAELTTIRQDHHAKGRLAGELLLTGLRGEAAAPPPLLGHELVARRSTAAPATV
jgi:DNA-binding LacI/PurR family transcriptional regulator